MRDPKDNPYGVAPKFEVGDEVKVWPVFKRPIGTVQSVIDGDKFPVKYLVNYVYEDGRMMLETFESSDLTLHRRHISKYSVVCECGTTTSGHSQWCPKNKVKG